MGSSIERSTVDSTAPGGASVICEVIETPESWRSAPHCSTWASGPAPAQVMPLACPREAIASTVGVISGS